MAVYIQEEFASDSYMNTLPYIYEIEPTNSCPYRCYMCPRGRGAMTRPVGFMTLSSFEKILSQAPPFQMLLRLHHFGESILHPDIGSFIRLAREAGFIPTISLNPSTLTDEMVARLTDSGVGIVCFSLDSLNSERLNLIRGIRKPVEYCLEMIDMFIKKSRNASYPVFKIIQMVSLTANKDERQSFLALKEKYHEDDVHIYISANYGFGDLSLVDETDDNGLLNLSSCESVCNAPFDDMVVLWNGDVVLCCYDYDGYNTIGNINEDTVEDIWNGEKVQAMRELFQKKETNRLPLCGECYLAPHNFPKSRHIMLKRGYTEERYILNLFPPFRELNNGRQ